MFRLEDRLDCTVTVAPTRAQAVHNSRQKMLTTMTTARFLWNGSAIGCLLRPDLPNLGLKLRSALEPTFLGEVIEEESSNKTPEGAGEEGELRSLDLEIHQQAPIRARCF